MRLATRDCGGISHGYTQPERFDVLSWSEAFTSEMTYLLYVLLRQLAANVLQATHVWVGPISHDASAVSFATISAAVVDAHGKLLMECLLETKASTMVDFIEGWHGTLSLTFEEGTSAAWLRRPTLCLERSLLH